MAFLPLVGFVVAAAVTYYANVVAFKLYGDAYARTTPVAGTSEPPTAQPAA